uniref:WDR11 TPR domain-containing protein n=1 Tax=Romanomermis culicivorax TaxID=13658 RepID=A0A915JVV5_ROMCU
MIEAARVSANAALLEIRKLMKDNGEFIHSYSSGETDNAPIFENSRSSVLKVVATNLIADGKLYEGVELLCLGGHTVDACRYLQSFGQWFEAYFLCKLSFEDSSDTKFKDLIRKWIDILLSPQVSRKTVAVYLLATIGDYEKILDILLHWKQVRMATKIIETLRLNKEKCHFWHKIENIHAQYSRLLFDIGLRELANVYAAKAGEMSEALLKEFKILSSDDESSHE